MRRPKGGDTATRLERAKLPQFAEGFKKLVKMLGGEDKIVAAFEQQLADNPDLAAIPGPHKRYGLFKAFTVWQEASNHGDQFLLVLMWTEEFGGKSRNFVVPDITGGWGEPVRPAFWVIVNNPTDHARLALTHVRKAPVFNLASYGTHFLAEVDKKEWQRRRFGAIHVVATFAIREYCPIMVEFTHRIAARLRDGKESTLLYGSASPNPAFNMHEMFADTAFKIAARALFNVGDAELDQWSRKIRWALQRSSTQVPEAAGIMTEWTELLKAMPDGKAGPMIGALRELAEELPETPTDAEKKAGRAGKKKVFRDDLLIVSLAMHDTTASTMTSCLMELARRPALQDRVAAECACAIASPAGLSYDDLHKMPTLTKCINETLRLWNAVAYGTLRQLDDDETVATDAGPRVVKRGTNIFLQNFTNHRSTALWGPDAGEWKPERWSGYADEGSFNFGGESGKGVVFSGRNPQSPRFHPFTRAPRQCFGMNFAQCELRVVLAGLLSEFKFRLAEPTVSRVNANVESVFAQISGILKPRDGMWMHVEPRAPAARL